MKIPRFYQAEPLISGKTLGLDAQNHRHAVQVLRLSEGDKLLLFNGEGIEAEAVLTSVAKSQSSATILAVGTPQRESALQITLAMSMIKSDKQDFALQKAVELGIQRFQPIYADRSVVRLKGKRLEKRIAHWQGVMINACEQSGRVEIPTLEPPVELSVWLESSRPPYCFAMLPGHYPDLNTQAIDFGSNAEQSVGLLVGPEGGFTPDEESRMISAGITPVSFGPRILRAETAVVAGLTALQLLWGDLKS